MRFVWFAVATGIGQLPATLLYSYLGDRVSGSIKALFLGVRNRHSSFNYNLAGENQNISL